jgi:hypothetical protein
MTITLTREEAQQVLDALEDVTDGAEEPHKTKEAIETLRTRLAQPEPEPVAWMYVNSDGECEQIEYGKVLDDPSVIPLYTNPPQREFKFSTTEEAIQPMPAPTGELQLTDDELQFADAMTTLIKAGYGKEAEVVLKSKQKQLDVEDRYCYRLAVMLEASLLKPERTWDDAHKLLDEYQQAIRQQADAAGLRRVSSLGKD